MKEQCIKYLWYSSDVGLSDDFDTEEECVADAYKTVKEYPSEYDIYCYDSSEHPNGDVNCDDCRYLGYIGGEYMREITEMHKI